MEKEAQAKDQQNDQDVGKDTAGATSSIKLLLKLSRMEDKSLGTSLPSPIIQVDGGQAVDKKKSTPWRRFFLINMLILNP